MWLRVTGRVSLLHPLANKDLCIPQAAPAVVRDRLGA